jgi:hypothetical protein
MKTALDQAQKGPGGLSFAETIQLLDATNAILRGQGCVPAGSPRPQAEDDLVTLMQTIVGMNLNKPESDDLTKRARDTAKNVVEGNPAVYCMTLSDLSAKIAADTGKKNKLTAAQGTTLSAAVAAIGAELGC